MAMYHKVLYNCPMQLQDTAQFYLIYPVSLSDLGKKELETKFSFHFPDSALEIISTDDAGILIKVKISEGFALNHLLRAPTRILLRIAEFKARDFPKLFQKISKLDWKPILIGQTPEIEVSATNSRLFDSRKVEKAIADGILENYRKQPVKKRYLDHHAENKDSILPKIYYRAVDDLVTISMDTTGELLHKRGEKIFTGLAPIRESLASLLLLELTDSFDGEEFTLIDPMSGSGTFLIEAHDYYKINTERSFSYQHTPMWQDFQTDGKAKREFFEKFKIKMSTTFNHFLGFEINKDIIELARKNADGKDIIIKEADIFDRKAMSPGMQNLVIINPPYGLRVGSELNISAEYYQKIIGAVKSKYNPERLGIIIPEEYRYDPRKNDCITLSTRHFKNGGLSVVFYVLGFK